MIKPFIIQGLPKQGESPVKSHSFADSQDKVPLLKGILMRRRCDTCGVRVDLKRETKDRVVLTCPRCQKDYVFTERP